MSNRRAKGEGAKARLRADGRWVAQLTVNGKRKTVYGKTEALANRKLRQAVTEAENGVLITGQIPTLEQWLDYWIEEICAVKPLKPNTLASYRSKVDQYVRGTSSAKKKLNQLGPEHIEALYAPLRERGLSETTILQLHRILSRALKVAVQRGKLMVNPATRMDAPTAADFAPEILNPDDARRLIKTAADMEDGARWMLALALGLRQGETLGMGWDQVDLEAGTLTVNRELMKVKYRHGCENPKACAAPNHCTPDGCHRKMRPEGTRRRVFTTERAPRKADHWNACPNPCPPGCLEHASKCPQRIGGLWIGTPKSDAGKRVLALPGPLLDAMRKHREQQDRILAEEGRTRQDIWTSNNGHEVDLVFCQRNGSPFNPRADWERWKTFLKESSVPEVRVHDARHTAATVLLLMGVDGRVVMDILGWSQASMLKRYQHVLDDMKRKAADAMTAALWTDPVEPAPEPEEPKIVSLDAFRKRRGA